MSGLNTTQRTCQHTYLPVIKASVIAVGLLLEVLKSMEAN